MDKEQILKENIKEIIREALQERKIRNHIRHIIKEEINKIHHQKSLNEAEGNAMIKRKAVMNLLKNGKFDHAYLAYKLWNPKDENEKDTYRSLFSKKASGKPDNDGAIRNFTDEEITKLYELLRKN